MKSPVDQGGTTGLILSGNGVRAPIRLQAHFFERHNLSKPLAVMAQIFPRFLEKVKLYGSNADRSLVPEPFVGRTRLAVNQGDEKQHEDLDHEWGPVQPCPIKPKWDK